MLIPSCRSLTGFLIAGCILTLSSCSAQPTAPAAAPTTIDHFTFTWSATDGSLRVHDALIERPAKVNGWRVMLIGGGSVTDEDWTLPGAFTHPEGGETLQFTIDGNATRDARSIAHVLTARGYTVWRWSSIHHDDPLHVKDPAMAEALSIEATVDLTRAALNAFAEHDPVPQGQLVLLAHSLGAVRATLTGADDPRVGTFVFLAGAYLSDLEGRPSAACAQAIEATGLDIDADGALTAQEVEGHESAFSDIDEDGFIRGWEIASTDALNNGGFGRTRDQLRPGLDWPMDKLLESGKPALAIFGGLDPITLHAPVLHMKAHEVDAPIDVVILPNRGHQLSEERDGRVTDIDEAVVEQIADWLDDLRASTRP